MTRTFDPEAARAELRGRLATNDAALAKVRERLGALALDVALGNAAQSELDAATSEQARLQATADALAGALAEVDKREAEQVAKDAAAERVRVMKLYRELEGQRAPVAERIVKGVRALYEVVDEMRALEAEAHKLHAQLDLPGRVVTTDGALLPLLSEQGLGERIALRVPERVEKAERELVRLASLRCDSQSEDHRLQAVS